MLSDILPVGVIVWWVTEAKDNCALHFLYLQHVTLSCNHNENKIEVSKFSMNFFVSTTV